MNYFRLYCYWHQLIVIVIMLYRRDCCWGIFFLLPDDWILLDWMFVDFINKIDVGWWKSVVVINSCFTVWDFFYWIFVIVICNFGMILVYWLWCLIGKRLEFLKTIIELIVNGVRTKGIFRLTWVRNSLGD